MARAGWPDPAPAGNSYRMRLSSDSGAGSAGTPTGTGAAASLGRVTDPLSTVPSSWSSGLSPVASGPESSGRRGPPLSGGGCASGVDGCHVPDPESGPRWFSSENRGALRMGPLGADPEVCRQRSLPFRRLPRPASGSPQWRYPGAVPGQLPAAESRQPRAAVRCRVRRDVPREWAGDPDHRFGASRRMA